MTKLFTDCPYWGMGGRYVVDPETGRRVPVGKMAQIDAAPAPAAAVEQEEPLAVQVEETPLHSFLEKFKK